MSKPREKKELIQWWWINEVMYPALENAGKLLQRGEQDSPSSSFVLGIGGLANTHQLSHASLAETPFIPASLEVLTEVFFERR